MGHQAVDRDEVVGQQGRIGLGDLHLKKEKRSDGEQYIIEG